MSCNRFSYDLGMNLITTGLSGVITVFNVGSMGSPSYSKVKFWMI